MLSDKAPIPPYAKIGWVVAWLVMLGLVAMMMRNCATSVIYGLKTDQQAIDYYYQAGISAGNSGQATNLPEETANNSVLRKAYITGYRAGIDQGRQSATRAK